MTSYGATPSWERDDDELHESVRIVAATLELFFTNHAAFDAEALAMSLIDAALSTDEIMKKSEAADQATAGALALVDVLTAENANLKSTNEHLAVLAGKADFVTLDRDLWKKRAQELEGN